MTPYEKWRAERCEGCRKGLRRLQAEGAAAYHREASTSYYAGPCTAPSREAFESWQAGEIERLTRAASVLGEITYCTNCDGSGQNDHGSCCRIPGHAKECKCLLCEWKNAAYRNTTRHLAEKSTLESRLSAALALLDGAKHPLLCTFHIQADSPFKPGKLNGSDRPCTCIIGKLRAALTETPCVKPE